MMSRGMNPSVAVVLCWCLVASSGFSVPFQGRHRFAMRSHRLSSSKGRGNHHGNKPPPGNDAGHFDFDHSDTPRLNLPASLATERNETERSNHESLLRGGASSTDNVIKGTQATLESSVSYWSKAFQSARSAITMPFRVISTKVGLVFQSSQQKRQAELLKQLETLPIQRVVIANNNTVLPQELVQNTAKRSGLLGQPLRTDRVQQFAQAMKSWYTRNGYVLHSVTGATLNTETATAEIAVNEPTCSSPSPVQIQFCKEMVVDNDSGAVMTLRQYKTHHTQRGTFGFQKDSGNAVSKEQLNMTLVPSDGRTNPLRIASALGLQPQRPFQWDASRWNRIVTSGIFRKVLHATPTQLPDGTIQLQILATEAPARHLEYGVGKSLYSGSWEGALEFEHVNLLGGGERLGLSVRRGTKDAEPSARLSFSDSKFGRPGGYDCEIFSEYIGEGRSEYKNNSLVVNTMSNDVAVDPTLDRKGATFRLHDKLFRNSMASVSLEQTVTKAGQYENIGSTSISLGPFVKELPLNARTNVDTVLTTGTRLVNNQQQRDEMEDASHRQFMLNKSLLPYSSMTATTRQLFPLTFRKALDSVGSESRPLLLALRHSLTASTQNLPRHVAKAQGIATGIRGSNAHDAVSSAVQGTMELRIPVTIPMMPEREQDASVIFFGDWLYSCQDRASPFGWKSSIGIGMRKNVKGFPLKVDLCYSPENTNNRLRLKPQFGLGGDFVV